MHTSMKRRIGSKKKKALKKGRQSCHISNFPPQKMQRGARKWTKNAVSKREAKQTKQLIPARINYNRRRKNETLKRDGRVTLKTWKVRSRQMERGKIFKNAQIMLWLVHKWITLCWIPRHWHCGWRRRHLLTLCQSTVEYTRVVLQEQNFGCRWTPRNHTIELNHYIRGMLCAAIPVFYVRCLL